MRLNREQVVWAYRMFLGREPESEAAIRSKIDGHQDLESLRKDMLTCAEFHARNAASALVSRSAVVVKEVREGLRIFVDVADVAIGKPIVEETYEVEELALLRRLVRAGDVVVDGGANVGLFTLVLADLVGPRGRVYSFEPFPRVAALLRRSIEENAFGDRVVFEQAALGARPGMLHLVSPSTSMHWGGSYLVADPGLAPPGHETREVRVLALDECRIPGPVRFVKLDVEGAEPLALEGAREILRRDRPHVLCEINAAQLERVSATSVERLISWMLELGFRSRAVTGGELDLRPLRSGEVPSLNVLFAPG